MNATALLAVLAAVVTTLVAPQAVATLAVALGFAIALLLPFAAVAAVVVAAGRLTDILDAHPAR